MKIGQGGYLISLLKKGKSSHFDQEAEKILTQTHATMVCPLAHISAFHLHFLPMKSIFNITKLLKLLGVIFTENVCSGKCPKDFKMPELHSALVLGWW